jgi:hypothetical protein
MSLPYRQISRPSWQPLSFATIPTNKKPAEANPLAGFAAALYPMPRLIHSKTESGERLAALVSPAAALSLAPLGAVLLLDADEAQAAAMLTDDAGALDPFCEPAQQLLKSFGFAELNSHSLFSPPSAPQQRRG